MIDPRKPDYSNTPVSAARPVYAYAPRGSRAFRFGGRGGRRSVRQSDQNGRLEPRAEGVAMLEVAHRDEGTPGVEPLG